MIPALINMPRQGKNPEMTALHFPAQVNGKDTWLSVTRREFSENVLHLAAALLSHGMEPQKTIGIFCENRPEVLLTDFAAWQLRAVPVSIYATSSPEQVAFICNDASIDTMLVGSAEQYAVAREAGMKRIILADPGIAIADGDQTAIAFAALLEEGHKAPAGLREKVDALASEATSSDLATLLYTSGTTGQPKGAMLTHGNFSAAFNLNNRRIGAWLKEGDTSLCFLPLSHIFELAWSGYCLCHSMPVYVNRDAKRIAQTIREVNPSCMCAVPRFWEKVYTVVMEKIDAMGAVSRTLTRRAIAVGRRRNLDYVRLGKKPPVMLEREYQMYNGRIFRKLRKAIGVDNGVLFPTAGAPLSSEIVEFFHSVGINVCIGYGLSETTATVSCFPGQDYVIGSIGTPLSGIQVRIGQDNEIQVNAPTVMAGYYNRPELNAEVFTADGWLRTGDAGRIDPDGNLYITDRIKDLFKTSNGKYIAPQAIESRLGRDPLFEQVAVVGDQRKFVTALIVPNYELLQKAAHEAGLGEMSRQELASNARVNEFVEKRIEQLTADLAPFEHIKRFRMLTHPFTIENGELTNTLKVRRRVVLTHYADLIDEMYQI